LDKVPIDGDIDQFTAVLLEPLTVALNVVDCPPVSEAVEGLIEMDTATDAGTSDMAALTFLEGSAALTAVTVIVLLQEMVAGAV
jgi:hypothetical protein